jgi:hypothetical protein
MGVNLGITLSEEHRLRVFESRDLRRIFGLKGDEVTGERRKLHNEALHTRILYSSPNIIWQIKSRRMRWAGHVSRMGEERNAYKVLMGKPEGKRPLGKPRRMWEDGIRMDLMGMAGECGVGCIWFIIGTGGGLLYYGDQPSGSGVTDLVRYLFTYLISSWGKFQQC